MFNKFKVNMGDIPLETLEAWASRNERIAQMREDESIAQKACALWEERCKALGVPERYIESIKRGIFKEDFKRNLVINIARGIMEEYFNSDKTVDELMDSAEWCQKIVDSVVDVEVFAMAQSSKSMHLLERIGLRAIVLGGIASAVREDEAGEEDNDDSGSESESDSDSFNDEA